MGESIGGDPITLFGTLNRGKGKETGSKLNPLLGRGGEGTSGTIKPKPEVGESRKPVQCLPKASSVPKLVIRSDRVREDIQYMKDHALLVNS